MSNLQMVLSRGKNDQQSNEVCRLYFLMVTMKQLNMLDPLIILFGEVSCLCLELLARNHFQQELDMS